MADSPSGKRAKARQWPGWLLLVLAAAALVKLWLVSAQPILALGRGSELDDRLFLKLASNLFRGHWLGAYDVSTLAKGCFYPMWIAMMHGVRLPLLLSQHLLYLAAVILFLVAVRPALPRPIVLLLLFLALWFNPSTYSVHALRVMREGIYPALTLLVIAGVVGVLVRVDGPRKVLWRWLLATGLALAAFWQTREEGVWLMPFVVPVLGWATVKLWRNRHAERRARTLMCLVPFAILAFADLAVAGINKVKYDVFATSEFKSPDFVAAYGALNRVKPKVWPAHVVVSREARESIYPVSPAFAELRPLLEGGVGRMWDCRILWPDLAAGEIGGGCFMWALRDAAARAGHHASGGKAMAYYRKVGQEIDAACAGGKLDCLPARASMVAPWRSEFNRPFLQTLARAPAFLAGFVGIMATPQPSVGSPASLALFSELTGNRLAPVGTPVEGGFRIRVLEACVSLFQKTMPVLALLALAIFFLKTILGARARTLSELWIVEVALLVAVLARLAILSIIEVTAFPGIDPLYLSAAYPVLIAFVVLALQQGTTAWTGHPARVARPAKPSPHAPVATDKA